MVKVIEKYILSQSIYKSQQSQVYKGLNTQSGEQVAIKVKSMQKVKGRAKLQDFIQSQISSLSKLKNCQYVVKFIQVLKTTNNIYFIYQYCDGGTLQNLLIQKYVLSQINVLPIFQQMKQAFKQMVKAKVMHRDLKPSNIFFNKGKINLGDFGFSKIYQNQDQINSTFVGSPIYMAPQILKGYPYTTKADIWSLGVVLYQILFGKCPYQEDTMSKLIKNIDSNQLKFPQPNHVSTSFQNLLKRMLIKDHVKRCDWSFIFGYSLQSDSTQDLAYKLHEQQLFLGKMLVQFSNKEQDTICQQLSGNILFFCRKIIRILQKGSNDDLIIPFKQQQKKLMQYGVNQNDNIKWLDNLTKKFSLSKSRLVRDCTDAKRIICSLI